MHASVNWATIGQDNGLSPDRRQVIIWISAESLLTGPQEQTLVRSKIERFNSIKYIWKCYLPHGGHVKALHFIATLSHNVNYYVAAKYSQPISVPYSFMHRNSYDFPCDI